MLLCAVLLAPALVAATELPVAPPPPAEPPPADTPSEPPGQAARPHPNPRAQVAYRNFAIAGLAGTPVGLNGAQLDVYPLSQRWIRVGLEAEVGAGDTTVSGVNAALWYGLGGLTAAIQYPGRVTPFVEGRVAGGLLTGSAHGAVTASGTTTAIQGLNANTLLYLGGVEAGVALYTAGRAYLSVSLGWVHPVYLGVNPTALQAGTIKVGSLAVDTFTFKIGLGI
jgi:hypothetical protein